MSPTPLAMDENIVTLTEAARRLHVSASTLHYLARFGMFPYRKIGGVVLVNLQDVAEALREHKNARRGLP